MDCDEKHELVDEKFTDMQTDIDENEKCLKAIKNKIPKLLTRNGVIAFIFSFLGIAVIVLAIASSSYSNEEKIRQAAIDANTQRSIQNYAIITALKENVERVIETQQLMADSMIKKDELVRVITKAVKDASK